MRTPMMSLADIRLAAAAHGYELRRKGRKQEKRNKQDADGNPILDCYMPHLPMTASEYARTKKVFAEFRRQVKKVFHADMRSDSEVYRHYLLLMNEHAARALKITDKGFEVVTKMMLPLPKAEWLVNKKVNTKGN